MNKKKIKCPYCKEKIDAGLDVCPICFGQLPQEDYAKNEQTTDSGDMHEESDGSSEGKNNKSKIVIILLSIITVLFVGICLTLLIMNKDDLTNFLFKTSYLEKGIKCYEDHDFENAKELFNKQIQKDNNAKAYYYLGKVYEAENSDYPAIYNYTQALRLNPKANDILVPLVKLCIKTDNQEGINEFVKPAYEFDKNNMEIALAYAKKLVNDNNMDEAVKILRIINQKDPKNMYVNTQLAHYYYDKGNIPEAYKFAKSMPIENLGTAKFVADICIKKEHFKEAMTIMEQADSRFGCDNELIQLYRTAKYKQYEYNYNNYYGY